jgi:predicted transcriptional regulator
MNIDILHELGLSPNEAKIYETLITYGTSGISAISLRSKIHRRNVYDTISRLMEKGLVYEVYTPKELVYQPVEPSKLLEIAQEKVRKVEQSIPAFQKAFHSTKTPERTYIYKGIEGIKNYLHDTLTIGKDVYVWGAKGAWFDPRLTSYRDWYFKEVEKKGMKIWVLFDDEVREHLSEVPAKVSKYHKFLPKKYSTHSAMDIFGDHVVTYSGLELGRWEEEVTAFVTVSQKIADTMQTWWQMAWDELPSVKAKKL